MKLLSLRAYAKHRGVQLQAVQKAIKAGRITLATGKNGKKGIDPTSADSQWDQNTDQGMQRKPDPEKTKASSMFADARATREDYLARVAKLVYEEKIGQLVDAETVKQEAFEAARIARDAILNIPNRISHELAGESDQIKVHALLTIELTKALEGLGNAGLRNAKK